ncbi:unnamed protein product [Rhizoctonia solani]|nr:unnamed protein product [Rhizoctonia solani]
MRSSLYTVDQVSVELSSTLYALKLPSPGVVLPAPLDSDFPERIVPLILVFSSILTSERLVTPRMLLLVAQSRPFKIYTEYVVVVS